MTAAKPRVKKYIPGIRLAELVKESGGKVRAEAVQDATARVERLRDASVDGIELALRQSEDLLHQCQDGHLTKDRLIEVQELADRVVTLAGTFGFTRLFQVARSLCELTNLLQAEDEIPVGPLLVHVHAAWLFAPHASAVPDESAQSMLSELAKVLDYFGVAPSAEAAAGNKHG